MADPQNSSTAAKVLNGAAKTLSVILGFTFIIPALKLLKAFPEGIFKLFELGIEKFADKEINKESTVGGAVFKTLSFISGCFGALSSLPRALFGMNPVQAYHEWGTDDARIVRAFSAVGELFGGSKGKNIGKNIGKFISCLFGTLLSLGGVAGLMALCSPAGVAAIGTTTGLQFATTIAASMSSAQAAIGITSSTATLAAGATVSLGIGLDGVKNILEESSTAKIMRVSEIKAEAKPPEGKPAPVMDNTSSSFPSKITAPSGQQPTSDPSSTSSSIIPRSPSKS